MPVPEIVDTNKLEDFSVDRHKRRLDAYAYSIENSSRHATVSNTLFFNTLDGIGLAVLGVTIAMGATWFLPYCALYLFGMYYAQVSQE